MTTFKLLQFNELIETESFFKFCKEESLEINQPAAINMWHDDWINQSHTLLHLLLVGNRFSQSNGTFFILYNGDIIVGCSGIYISEISNEIAMAGCRTWITRKYRNLSLVREWFLPAQKEWAMQQKCKAIALSFNEYNKNIIEIWKRSRLGEHRPSRQPFHMFYNNFNQVAFPVNIQHIRQWVIYEKLDQEWDFNWATIECK